jgi:hypothetical protein
METKPSLAFQISRDFSHLFCELHHLGISTRNAKENTVIKVCCKYFRDEVEKALQKKFDNSFVNENIRFQLPALENTGISGSGAMPEE